MLLLFYFTNNVHIIDQDAREKEIETLKRELKKAQKANNTQKNQLEAATGEPFLNALNILWSLFIKVLNRQHHFEDNYFERTGHDIPESEDSEDSDEKQPKPGANDGSDNELDGAESSNLSSPSMLMFPSSVCVISIAQ